MLKNCAVCRRLFFLFDANENPKSWVDGSGWENVLLLRQSDVSPREPEFSLAKLQRSGGTAGARKPRFHSQRNRLSRTYALSAKDCAPAAEEEESPAKQPKQKIRSRRLRIDPGSGTKPNPNHPRQNHAHQQATDHANSQTNKQTNDQKQANNEPTNNPMPMNN